MGSHFVRYPTVDNGMIYATGGYDVGVAHVIVQDWPQFLGPESKSTSPQKGILHTCPETGSEVLWTVGSCGKQNMKQVLRRLKDNQCITINSY